MSNESTSREDVLGISLLAALPLILLKLVYLFDIQHWLVGLFGYGMIFLLIPPCFVLMLGCLGLEWYLRSKRLTGIRQFPWFALIAAMGLLSFFYVGEWLEPIVVRYPQWSRAHQSLDWSTSNDERFSMGLSGHGNIDNHKFSSAHLYWSGEGTAGISDIKFRPIRFGHWENYDHIFVDGTSDELRKHLAPADLPAEELEALTAEIWEVLMQASDGLVISAPTAKVEPVEHAPFGEEHIILGGMLWMLVLLVSFVAAGQWTLLQSQQANSPSSL